MYNTGSIIFLKYGMDETKQPLIVQIGLYIEGSSQVCLR